MKGLSRAMDSPVASMSSMESPLSARQTFGRFIGRKRGARVEGKAKAICFQRRRDITRVQPQMQHQDYPLSPGTLWRERAKHPRNLDPDPVACYFPAVTLVFRET